MIEKTKTNPMDVGRHSGDNIWGYEVKADGTIRLSPGFADRLRVILDREQGLLVMQEGIARFVATEMSRTAKERREWWDTLAKDLGVDIIKGSGWMSNIQTGCVSQPKEESSTEPKKE